MNSKTLIAIIVLLAIVIIGGYVIYDNFSQKNSPTVVKTTETPTKKATKTATSASDEYIDISVKEAKDMLDEDDEIMIIDVSPKYEEGHIPGSVNAYVGDGTLEEELENWDKDGKYLVYCHVDSASIAGAQALKDAGFENVYRLEGNYKAWEDAGYPTIEDIENISGVYYGDLEDVTGADQNGIGYVYDNTESTQHKVIATLDKLPTGSFYEGWLVDKNTDEFFFYW